MDGKGKGAKQTGRGVTHNGRANKKQGKGGKQTSGHVDGKYGPGIDVGLVHFNTPFGNKLGDENETFEPKARNLGAIAGMTQRKQPGKKSVAPRGQGSKVFEPIRYGGPILYDVHGNNLSSPLKPEGYSGKVEPTMATDEDDWLGTKRPQSMALQASINDRTDGTYVHMIIVSNVQGVGRIVSHEVTRMKHAIHLDDRKGSEWVAHRGEKVDKAPTSAEQPTQPPTQPSGSIFTSKGVDIADLARACEAEANKPVDKADGTEQFDEGEETDGSLPHLEEAIKEVENWASESESPSTEDVEDLDVSPETDPRIVARMKHTCFLSGDNDYDTVLLQVTDRVFNSEGRMIPGFDEANAAGSYMWAPEMQDGQFSQLRDRALICVGPAAMVKGAAHVVQNDGDDYSYLDDASGGGFWVSIELPHDKQPTIESKGKKKPAKSKFIKMTSVYFVIDIVIKGQREVDGSSKTRRCLVTSKEGGPVSQLTAEWAEKNNAEVSIVSLKQLVSEQRENTTQALPKEWFLQSIAGESGGQAWVKNACALAMYTSVMSSLTGDVTGLSRLLL